MEKTNNTFNEIIKDNKISETEFHDFIETKFQWLNENSKEKLQDKYQNLKEKLDKKWEKITNITTENLSLLKTLFLTENKEEVTNLAWLAKYFNIDKNKLEKVSWKLLKAWLKPANFLSKYKNIIETKLSWLKNIPNWDKFLDKIKLSIWKRFIDLNNWLGDLKDKVSNWKTIYDYKWDINDMIQDKFNIVNTEILPSVELLIKEWWKIDQRKWYWTWKENDKLEETINMLNSKVLENWDFDKTWTSWEIIDANTNTWNIFDTDGMIEGSTDKAILSHEWINEIESINTLSETDKKIEAEATAAIIWYVLAMLVPVAWDIASLPADIQDILWDQDGLIQVLKQTWQIPENYNRVNHLSDKLLWVVWVIASLTVIFWVWIGINKILKSWKLAKYTNKLKKLWVKNPEKMIEESFNKSNNKLWKKIDLKEENKIMTPNPELVKRNAKLKPQERIDKASQLLEKNFSLEQKNAILEAHDIWKNDRESWIYNYSQEQLTQKTEILKDAWFNKNERRILMDNGIVGKIPSENMIDKIKWILWIKQKFDNKLNNLNPWDIIEIYTWNSIYVFKKIDNHTYKSVWWNNENLIWNIINKQEDIKIQENWTIIFWWIQTSKVKNIKIIDNIWIIKKSNEIKDIHTISKLSNLEINNFLKQTSTVSKNILDNQWQNALPKHRIIIKWREFLVTDKSNWKRKDIIAYTKQNWVYEPRLFYFSKSWGNWHSSPWVRWEDMWYSKWEIWNLWYEKWTVLDNELASQLNSLKVNNQKIELEQLFNLWFKDLKYQNKTEEVSNINILDWYPSRSFSDYSKKEMNIDYAKYLFEKIDVKWINLNFWKIKDWWESIHSSLWKIKHDIVETNYNWKNIEIVFAKSLNDRPDLVWIEDIRFKDNNINSFWFSTKKIKWWWLTTKPLEYIQQVPLWVRRDLQMKGWYIDIREIYQTNPLIKAYKQQKTKNI